MSKKNKNKEIEVKIEGQGAETPEIKETEKKESFFKRNKKKIGIGAIIAGGAAAVTGIAVKVIGTLKDEDDPMEGIADLEDEVETETETEAE